MADEGGDVIFDETAGPEGRDAGTLRAFGLTAHNVYLRMNVATTRLSEALRGGWAFEPVEAATSPRTNPCLLEAHLPEIDGPPFDVPP